MHAHKRPLHGSPLLLLCLLPHLCNAQIDPRAESLYQQALPYLQQANTQLEAVPPDLPTAAPEEKQRAMALIDKAGKQLKPAIPLLEQAAALDHPAAQHRLAMTYVLLYPTDVIKEKACPLFERSLAQGFAPAALGVASWCWEFTATPDYPTQLQAIDASAPAYQQYYPQPVVRLECRSEMPQGLAMQWGSSRDYQAEIYRLLGDSNRAQRETYYRKALAINDCDKAKKWLERQGL